MTAKIIQFPVQRTRPLLAHELPEHWGKSERGHYLHVTYDGFNSHEDAFAYCEAMSRVPPQQAGESLEYWTLRRARAAISTLKPRRQS